MKNILNFTTIITLFMASLAPSVLAQSISESKDYQSVIYDSVFYDGDSQQIGACAGGGSSSLEGYLLPATKGGVGLEEAINEQGQVASTGGKVSFADNASLGQEYRDYYITMRWRYRVWNWNGTSSSGPEDVDFYRRAPRVLVTNPRTGKSIIAVVLESGPAPWTGVDRGPNNNPKQGWVNPQDGTPSTYTGRVSGLPPVAFNEIGATQRMSDGSGDDLLYEWAPDQNATPGPTSLSASVESNGRCPGGIGDLILLPSFNNRRIQPVTAVVLHWTGGLYDNVDQFLSAIRSNTACGSEGCSVQLYASQEGEMYQLTDPIDTLAFHAAGINSNSIGIEIEGRGEDDLLSSQAQFESVVQTVISLVSQFNISLEPDVEGKKGILGHYETDAASYGGGNGKSDPGEIYLQKVRDEVNRRLVQ